MSNSTPTDHRDEAVKSFENLLAKRQQTNVGDVMNTTIENELASFGIEGTTTYVPMKDKNGNPVFGKDGKPVYARQFTPTYTPKWFVDALPMLEGTTPCTFEGCEEIREAYKAELNSIKGCAPCQKGGLIRKYMKQIQAKMPASELNKVAPPSTPPVVITNKSTNTVTHVPRKEVPYATIKRRVPESLKEAFTNKEKERKLIVHTSNDHSEIARIINVPGPDGESAS